MKNLNKLAYTFQHRQAFLYVLHRYFSNSPYYKPLLKRAAIHDLDKSLFLTLCDDEKEAKKFHRANARHHMENSIQKSTLDLYEAIIDYESAGFTKEDKPFNAYDTIIYFNKPHAEEMLKILKQYGMDHSYDNTPNNPDWKLYKSYMLKPTLNNIMEEIYNYVKNNPYDFMKISSCLAKTFKI